MAADPGLPVEGEDVGTASEVCDTLRSVVGSFLTVGGCECACLLSGEAVVTGQTRMQQEKQPGVCVPVPFAGSVF